MNKVRKQRLTITLVVMVAVMVAGGLIFSFFKDNASFFYVPSKALLDSTPIATQMRVGGMVKQGSIIESKDPQTKEILVQFILFDEQAELTVRFYGVLPDLFAENSTAIAHGQLNAERIFVADEILAKHDENYIPQELKHSYSEQGIKE